jgi:hypothetical protein
MTKHQHGPTLRKDFKQSHDIALILCCLCHLPIKYCNASTVVNEKG